MNTDMIERRWERARAEMERRDLDAIVVSDKYNYWYFTGHLSREFDKKMRPMLFLLPRSGDPALIVYRQAAKAAKRSCPVEHAYTYEDVPFQPELIVEALRDRSLQSGRIGMEFGENERLGISYTHLQHVSAEVPGATFVDAGDILRELRLIKTADEVELIRTACRMSLDAWKKALAQLNAGVTNAEIKTILAAELSAAGSDFDVAGHITVGNGVAGEEGYKPGEAIWCDFGATYGGYQADLARRALFGPETDEHRRVHEQISAILRAEIEAIRPGVKASDVAAVVSEKLEEAGYPPLGPKKRVGHGLGLAPAEAPSLSLADDTVLRPGMVLTPEPRFNLESGEKVHIEEVVVVTEDGCEQLTHGAETLDVIT